VVNMGVSAQDIFNLELMFENQRKDELGIIARVNHYAFAGFHATENVTVALQRANSDGFEDHGSSCLWICQNRLLTLL
jgi:hypothetical protein